jgi:lysophospholipase L1-like esterase
LALVGGLNWDTLGRPVNQQPIPSQPNAAPSAESSTRRKRRKKGCLLWLSVLVFLLLVAAELVARFKYDLGDPPLFVADPEIEYVYKPSSSYHRFGNEIRFNAWSMRSDEFAQRKSDPDELRIMVLGDSVINGGAWTDQADIATEVLRRSLQSKLNRPVTVGNVSAGSWGPPNLLAYIEKFGFFDADAIIIVLGSEDYGDAPNFAPLGGDKPTRTPALAIEEVLTRYVPALVKWVFQEPGPPKAYSPTLEETDSSTSALRRIIDLAREENIPIAVGLHKERSELTGSGAKPGYLRFKELLENRRVPVIELGPPLAQAINAGQEPYRDWVHPNALGQKLIAEAIEKWILEQIR